MRNHAAEVVAMAEVVRSTLADLENDGTPISASIREAFSCVESWIAGAPITKEALTAAIEAAHQTRKAPEERERDVTLTWASTAVGNLAWMALKPRGWQDGPRVVMDAAVCTFSSRGLDSADTRMRLDALRSEALDRALVEGVRAKAPKSAASSTQGRNRRVKDELLPFIGAVASARLSTLKAIFDPRAHANDIELRKLMKARGYTLYEPVLAFERRYGGLVMPDVPGGEGSDWQIGAFACLSSDAHSSPRGGAKHLGANGKRALIPVAYSPNDIIYFLDGNGAAWVHDTIEEREAVPYARDADRMVARILFHGIAFGRRFSGHWSALDGKRGEEVAALFRIPLVSEGSDHLARVWADPRRLVIEQRLLVPGPVIRGPWQTIVTGADKKKTQAALTKARLLQDMVES